MTTADQLRAEGQALAEQAADMRVVAIIDALIAEANASGQPWSANDIRDRFPSHRSKGLVGARVDAARKRGEMSEPVGWVKSTLPFTRGHRIAVWLGNP